MKKRYPDEIEYAGNVYVRGPALPEGTDRCEHCVGISDDAACECMGWECLHADPVYWILKPAGATGASAAGRATCIHCGSKHSVAAMTAVTRADGTVERWCEKCFVTDGAICRKCGKKTAKSESSTVNGDVWCAQCRDASSKKCERCGEYYLTGTGTAVNVHGAVQHWCDACSEAHSAVCAHCHTRGRTEDTVTVDAVTWCNSCADEHAAPCEDCGNLSANLEFYEPGDRYLCSTCFSRTARTSANVVHGYHGWGRSPNFHGAAKNSAELFLGFELESGDVPSNANYLAGCNEAHALDPEEDHFHFEHDGSIPEYGAELISAPHTLAAHESYGWEPVLKTLIKRGFKSHNTGGACGLHVHVSRAFLSADDCAKLDLITVHNKAFWDKVARRGEVHYAQYIKKAGVSEYGRSGSRYCAVNFSNDKTVEFRLFRGTLKHDTLMATLQIVDGMCRWIKTRTVTQINKNDGELELFAAWLKTDMVKYGRAVAYIEKRKALTDPNMGDPDAAQPEL